MLVVDLFHVVQLAVKMAGDVRRRVARTNYGRGSRSGDPEYSVKRLLGENVEALSGAQFAKIIETLARAGAAPVAGRSDRTGRLTAIAPAAGRRSRSWQPPGAGRRKPGLCLSLCLSFCLTHSPPAAGVHSRTRTARPRRSRTLPGQCRTPHRSPRKRTYSRLVPQSVGCCCLSGGIGNGEVFPASNFRSSRSWPCRGRSPGDCPV